MVFGEEEVTGQTGHACELLGESATRVKGHCAPLAEADEHDTILGYAASMILFDQGRDDFR